MRTLVLRRKPLRNGHTRNPFSISESLIEVPTVRRSLCVLRGSSARPSVRPSVCLMRSEIRPPVPLRSDLRLSLYMINHPKKCAAVRVSSRPRPKSCIASWQLLPFNIPLTFVDRNLR